MLKMTAINPNQIAADSTDTWQDYNTSSTLPDFSARDAVFNKFGKLLNDFFAFENHPQIPFYDTPQGAIFSGSDYKKVQIKRRILEHQAKY